ncbi:MAG: hypothetical protein IPL79_07260 [Myxococcales bacterium]|nr:hypothetical protein [Myxococcales bacterium]
MEALLARLGARSERKLTASISPRELLRSTQIYKRSALSSLFELRFMTAVYARMLTFSARYQDEHGAGRLEDIRLIFDDDRVQFLLTLQRAGKRVELWDVFEHQGFVDTP